MDERNGLASTDHVASDNDLVALYQAMGDKDGGIFEELYRRHKRKVSSISYWMLGRPEYVEDFTQQVFLQLYRKIGTLYFSPVIE